MAMGEPDSFYFFDDSGPEASQDSKEGSEADELLDKGIEQAVDYIVDRFGGYLAGDNPQHQLFVRSPEGKALVKKMINSTIRKIVANGVTDDRGQPLHEGTAKQIQAGLSQILNDMAARAKKKGQVSKDVDRLLSGKSPRELTREVASVAEGMLYDHQDEIEAAASQIEKRITGAVDDASDAFDSLAKGLGIS